MRARIIILAAMASSLLAWNITSCRADITGWEYAESMPEVRYSSAAVSLGAVFVIGGMDGTAAPTTTVFRHDPCWNTWLFMDEMQFARSEHAAAVLNGLIYVTGGQGQSSLLGSTEVYDPMCDSWQTVAGLNTPRRGHGMAAIDGRIYVFGGLDSVGMNLANGEAYDPDTNSWTTLADSPMATPRAYFPLVEFEGELHALAGEASSALIRDVESFDAASGLWTERNNLGTARSHVASAKLYNPLWEVYELFAIGGLTDFGPTARVDSRSSSSTSWNATGTDLAVPRYAHTACQLGDVIHVLGGYNDVPLYSHEVSMPRYVEPTEPPPALIGLSASPFGFDTLAMDVPLHGDFDLYLLLQGAMLSSLLNWECRIDWTDNISLNSWSPVAPGTWSGELPGNIRFEFDDPVDSGSWLISLSCKKIGGGPGFFYVSAHDTSSIVPPEPCYGDDIAFCLPANSVCGNDGQPVFLTITDPASFVGYDLPTAASEISSYPNPFNPSTAISYALPEPGHVTLSVYDLSGRLIKTLVDTHMSAGQVSAEWNGTDSAGKRIASGTYFLRLKTDQGVRTRKVMLAK